MDRKKIVYYHRKIQLQPTRRKKNRISKTSFLIFFCLFIGISIFLQTRPNSAPEQKVLAEQIQQPSTEDLLRAASPLQRVTFPEFGQAALGTLELGVIKHTENETQAPIASITKVITALVILDKRPIPEGTKGDSIVLNEKDLQYFNDYYAKLGTVTTVVVGASMSQYEALQAMLLPSSNNISDSLIDRYFASREEYLSYANEFLRKNGLENTVVGDASGFSPESKSTPSDLIKIGQLALRDPVIREVVAQPNASLAVAGDVPNYNPLIREPDVIGIKPGTTDEAGYCLLFAAVMNDKQGTPQTVIAVSMGQTDRPQYLASVKLFLDDIRTQILQ